MAGFLYICFDVILPKQSTFGFRGNDRLWGIAALATVGPKYLPFTGRSGAGF